MMDVSSNLATPMRAPPHDLRRQTLMKTTLAEPSPLRRRSLLPAQTPEVVLEKSNDDNERSTRRSRADIQRKISNIPQSPLDDTKNIVGEQDMKDHFSICTKLFSENKINTKNAWQLHIIDLLKDISQKSGSDNLQLASTSLDISAKVYSVRVDDVHAVGLKLANSMARVTEKETPNNDDHESDGEDPGNMTTAKKRKKRTALRKKETICNDPESLLGNIPKLESVFFSTRTNAETSSIDNLFTNVLKMDNSGYKFMLLSKEPAWTTGPDPLLAKLREGNGQKFPFQMNKELGQFEICPQLKNFVVDEWDLDEEEKQREAEKTLRNEQEEVMFDDQGIPIAELDGSIHDVFSNDNDNNDFDVDMENDEAHDEFTAHIRNEIVEIQNFGKAVDSGNRSEYSYNNVIQTFSGVGINQIWAGPSHWKLKFIKRRNLRYSCQDNEAVPGVKFGRKRNVPEPIRFDDMDDLPDFSQSLKIKKKIHTVEPIKITYPLPDLACRAWQNKPLELMSKPRVMSVKKQPNENPNEDYEVADYRYENPNDSQYCSQKSANDSDDGGPDHDDDGPDHDDGPIETEFVDNVACQQNFLADNLIEMPDMVSKTYVPFVSQAKKMDMKKLKSAVWTHLIKPKIAEAPTISTSEEVQSTNFSTLYKELPKLISEKMRKELSAPLAFVALLHVCNEQNLQLIQAGSRDFQITRP